MKALEAHQLSKIFRSQGKPIEAVKQVSLEINAGEVLAFLGPNGAGKTTTIKMIAGLIKPDTGYVRIAGRDPFREVAALEALGAVLEGNRNVYWRLTPEQNLDYFGVLKGLTRSEARQRGQALLDQFELTEKRQVAVQTLSRGMQQKLAIAVAMIHKPKLLLLDEPTLGLDVEATITVKNLIKQIAAEGHAILLTTHQLDIAEALADRVMIIQKGKIITESTPQYLIRQFSGSTYSIEVECPLDPVRRRQLETMGAEFKSDQSLTFTGDPTDLYQVLGVIKPLPLLTVKRDEADLTKIFLKLVRHHA